MCERVSKGIKGTAVVSPDQRYPTHRRGFGRAALTLLDETETTETDARGHPAVGADGSRIMESFSAQCQSVVERQAVSLRRAFSPCL